MYRFLSHHLPLLLSPDYEILGRERVKQFPMDPLMIVRMDDATISVSHGIKKVDGPLFVLVSHLGSYA